MVYTILRPGRGWLAIDIAELFRFRDLLFMLASRDVKLRYRQTALGVTWVLFQPLAAAGVLTFVFGVVAGLKTGQVPHFASSFVGLLAWNVFGTTLSKTSASMIGNAHLVSRVYFPRLIIPLSMVLATLIDLAISLIPMGLLLAAYRLQPGWPVLLLPAWVLLLLMLSLGLGLMAAAAAVPYRDVQHVLPVLIPLLLYASPVAYQVANLPEAYRDAFMLVNPVASLIEGFRWSLTGGPAPPLRYILWSVAVATSALLAGASVFRRLERRLADVI